MECPSNLRQEATAGARALVASDGTPCAHLSEDPLTRGKQIRAFVVDRVIDLADGKGPNPEPTFSRVAGFETPLDSFLQLAGGNLAARCGLAIDEIAHGEDARLIDMFTSTFDHITGLPDLDLVAVKEYISGFAKTGVAFTITAMNLAIIAMPSASAEEICIKMRSSYAGIAKKFTGGKSRAALNVAAAMIAEHPSLMTGNLQLDREGGLRLSPKTLASAVGAAGPGQMRLMENGSDDGGPASNTTVLCPASLQIHIDQPAVTERVWNWTLGVAERSELAERLKELVDTGAPDSLHA